jgi:hypothetical protein
MLGQQTVSLSQHYTGAFGLTALHILNPTEISGQQFPSNTICPVEWFRLLLAAPRKCISPPSTVEEAFSHENVLPSVAVRQETRTMIITGIIDNGHGGFRI